MLMQVWKVSERSSVTCATPGKEEMDGEAVQMQVAMVWELESLLDYAEREVGDWLTE
jgi:hypothetical protein